MKKTFLLIVFTVLFSQAYTQNSFLFNPMLYNPAFVGVDSLNLSLVNNNAFGDASNRLDNAQTLNFSMLKGQFGLGSNLTRTTESWNDDINGNSTENTFGFNIFGAFHKQFKRSTLSFGLSTGVTRNHLDIDYSNVGGTTFVITDYLFNLGLGALYYSDNGFISVSSNNLFSKEKYWIYDNLPPNLLQIGYYPKRILNISGGLTLPFFLSEFFLFKPSFTIKQGLETVFREKTIVQLNASFLMNNGLWLNSSYETKGRESFSNGDNVDFSIGYYFKKSYHIGINIGTERVDKKLSKPNSLEVVLRYRKQ